MKLQENINYQNIPQKVETLRRPVTIEDTDGDRELPFPTPPCKKVPGLCYFTEELC